MLCVRAVGVHAGGDTQMERRANAHASVCACVRVCVCACVQGMSIGLVCTMPPRLHLALESQNWHNFLKRPMLVPIFKSLEYSAV